MFELKIYGKTIRLTNKDYVKILKRFNPNTLGKEFCGRRETAMQCPLCEKYNRSHEHGCEKCTFFSFDYGTTAVGCVNLLKKIFKSNEMPFWLGYGGIRVYTKTEEKNLQKVYNKLLIFKKV